MKKNTIIKPLICSFCSMEEKDVDFLVEGEDAYICDSCVAHASDIIKEKNYKELYSLDFNLQKPMEIKNILDEYIIPAAVSDGPIQTKTEINKTFNS